MPKSNDIYSGLGLVNELSNLRHALNRRDGLASELKTAKANCDANEKNIEDIRLRLGAHLKAVGRPEIVDVDDELRAFLALPDSTWSLNGQDPPKATVTFCSRRSVSR